ncbi:hypothetical protein MAPG_10318 [Magnaporthiopsis poae ATCC 64411]|uniref:SRR1-like domain-containing protein n=1 Tax=Magnaporthiopsis poae (strain ATCC 64411 / 73-15) TaxID=644358 RepID=A0A0C4ECA3_MAGP6|nr:hypothetical protein MAPG_10318 [Magnaporthiopsis poae ATCC 64411]
MPPPHGDNGGAAWNTVPSRRRNPVTSASAHHTTTANKAAAATAPMSPDELERAVTEIDATYTRVRDRWLASPAYSTLRALILTGAASHAPRRHRHFCPESHPLRVLGTDTPPADRAFLQRRGHDVVDDPAAFGLESRAGQLCGNLRPMSRSPGSSGATPSPPPPLPAMFVGTKWTTWEDVADDDGRIKDSLSRVAEMHATYDMLEFPPDEASFSFGDTCIYWRREDTSVDSTENPHCAAPTVEPPPQG